MFVVLTRRGTQTAPRDLVDWATVVVTPEDVGRKELYEEALRVDPTGKAS